MHEIENFDITELSLDTAWPDDVCVPLHVCFPPGPDRCLMCHETDGRNCHFPDLKKEPPATSS